MLGRGHPVKILWVTNRPIAGAERKLNIKSKSGTWMEPALVGVQGYPDFIIEVAFLSKVEDIISFEAEGTTFYQIPIRGKKTYPWKSEECRNDWKKVIDLCKPDLLVIWGTEYSHGLCAQTVAEGIPCVIETQGIMESVWEYYLGGMTPLEVVKSYSIWNIIKHNGLLKKRHDIKNQIDTEKEMINRAGNVIVENEWATCHIKAISPKCNVFYHNLNINEVFFQVERNEKSIEKHSIFCSAPGYPLKGFHLLIKAISIVKKTHNDIKLYVPGINSPFKKGMKRRIKQDGYEKYLAKLIERYDLKESIVFLGKLSSKEMAEFMARSSVMVIPSAIENHSITLREAMAMGMPCVSSYVGGVPEVVNHKVNGLLYRYEDYQQCAFFINYCLDNSSFSVKIGKKAQYDMKEHLDSFQTTNQLVSIYQDVVKFSN